MALPNPEGVAFFSRKGLHTSGSWAYNPDKAEDFYSHFLLQIVPNQFVVRTWSARDCNLPFKNHPRAGEWYWSKDGYDEGTKYKYLVVCYGDKDNNITRTRSFHTNGDYWKHRDSNRISFVPVPMPDASKGETHMFIDLTFPIRKVFFPLAQCSGERYPDQCTFGHLDFTRMNLTLQTNKDMEINFPPGNKLGLDHHPYWTLKFDMIPLLIWLAIPVTDRAKGTEPNNFISGVSCWDIQHTSDVTWDCTYLLQEPYILDLVKVLNENMKVQLQYAPSDEDPGFIKGILKSLITNGLGFVPGIGTILALSVDLAWDAIDDWDKFAKEFKDIPDLGASLIGSSKETLDIAKKLMKKRR